MRTQSLLGALVIVLLTAGAIVVVWPAQSPIMLGTWQVNRPVRLGLDLQGGSHLVYRANVAGISSDEVTDALSGVRDVIERRINAFGISEPVVQTNRVKDEFRVIVELAGVHDPKQAIALIGETPQLDFRREVSEQEAVQQFNIDDRTQIKGPIFERTQLTGKQLKRATVAFDQVSGTPEVTLEFNSEGSELFAQLTRQNLQKRIAIYLDGVPISAPVVQSEITNGRAVISGGFSVDEAKQLARRLNAGALPVPIELIGQQTIGPSLGRSSIQQSIAAGIIGLLAVVFGMSLYYRVPGAIASVALVLYALFFLSIIKLTGVTLTLAGVAGFIMSIGMSVDANVLIFEQFRENLRLGKNIPYAMEDGFRRAWGSIRASNVSSLITALILYWFGTSIVRGFALTYAMGIVLSMFTAIALTRTLMRFVIAPGRLRTKFWLSATPASTSMTQSTPS